MSDQATIALVLGLGVVCLRFVWDVFKHGWGTEPPRTRTGMEARGRFLGCVMVLGLGALALAVYLVWYESTYGSLK